MDLRLEIEITKEDVQLITSEQMDDKIETFCPNCRTTRRLRIREYWLNHICDITLEGNCTVCKRSLSHYLDTGIEADSYDQAMAIRELKMNVLQDYNARPYKPQQY